MPTSAHRGRTPLTTDLISWVGTVGADPDIRIEEYIDGGRRIVRADLPGVDPDHDIDISVEREGLLRLRGLRREEQRDKSRTETRYGTFERALSLPSGTTADQVSATYENGVLTVTFPAGEPEVSHRVPITRPELPAE